MQVILTICLLPILLPLLAINTAYPLAQVWNMFMPLIGIPTITVPIAIGLTVLHSYFWHSTYYKDMEEDKNRTVISALLKPWLCLLFAWITFQFVDVKTKAVQAAVPAEPVPAHSTATPEVE